MLTNCVLRICNWQIEWDCKPRKYSGTSIMNVLKKIFTPLFISALFALFVACATNVPTPAGSIPAPTTRVEPLPTHRPRQHSMNHIDGLGEPIDAPHFVDSFPNHSQTLTQVPRRIGINFDIPLTAESSITLERDGETLALAPTEFDARKIYMSAKLKAASGDGLYLAKYRACFANAGCSEGQIGFRVDAAQVKNFVDLTPEKKVMIHLRDVKYQPNQIIISQGTTVTWVNDDPFEHFVNSDPHPSHNAFPDFNSLDIPPQETFTYTFDESGEYNFHCSAHVPQNMFGTILVRANVQTQNLPTTFAQATLALTTIARNEPTATPVAPTPIPPTRAPTNVPPTAIPPTLTPALPHKVDIATLPQERFAAHYVSSSPAHADLVTRAPDKIQIDFNFILARNSNINVLKDGEKLALGALEFSENRLQMSVNLPDAGAGTYHVLYRACWPDKSCHDGEFAFVVR